MQRVLIIDDDVKLQELLAEYLKGYGFEVFYHDEGIGVTAAVEKFSPEIILLDIMLPGKNGIEVLREIRDIRINSRNNAYGKGDEADRIVGLELGADDYMSKPFSPRELLARIKAVLRRSSTDSAAPQSEAKSQRISSGGICIDPQSMLMECGTKKIELSKTEFRILETFLRNPNIVLSRDAIMNSARGRDFMAFERSIDVHVSKLRTKVEEISGDKK